MALAVPVVGVGVLARVISLKTTGLIFAGIVMGLAAIALGLLLRGTERQPAED